MQWAVILCSEYVCGASGFNRCDKSSVVINH